MGAARDLPEGEVSFSLDSLVLIVIVEKKISIFMIIGVEWLGIQYGDSTI